MSHCFALGLETQDIHYKKCDIVEKLHTRNYSIATWVDYAKVPSIYPSKDVRIGKYWTLLEDKIAQREIKASFFFS